MPILNGDSLAGDWEVGAGYAHRDTVAEEAVGRSFTLTIGGVAVIGSSSKGDRVSTVFVARNEVGLRFTNDRTGKTSLAQLSVKAWDADGTKPIVLGGTMTRTGDEPGNSPYAMGVVMRRVSK